MRPACTRPIHAQCVRSGLGRSAGRWPGPRSAPSGRLQWWPAGSAHQNELWHSTLQGRTLRTRDQCVRSGPDRPADRQAVRFPHRPIESCSGQQRPPIGVTAGVPPRQSAHPPYRAAVAGHSGDDLSSGGRVPNPHRRVVARGGQQGPPSGSPLASHPRQSARPPHGTGMAGHRGPTCRPEAGSRTRDRPVGPDGGQQRPPIGVTAGVPPGRVHTPHTAPVWPVIAGPACRPRGRIPDPDRPVATDRGDYTRSEVMTRTRVCPRQCWRGQSRACQIGVALSGSQRRRVPSSLAEASTVRPSDIVRVRTLQTAAVCPLSWTCIVTRPV